MAAITEKSLGFFLLTVSITSGHHHIKNTGNINHGYTNDVIRFTSKKNTVTSMALAIENIVYFLLPAKYKLSGHHATAKAGYINHGCPK